MRNVQLTSRLLQHNLYLRIINLLIIRHKNNMGCGASVERSISKEWLALFRKLKLTRSELRSLFNMHRKFMDKYHRCTEKTGNLRYFGGMVTGKCTQILEFQGKSIRTRNELIPQNYIL